MIPADELDAARQRRSPENAIGRSGCINCGRPLFEHCHVHVVPCCPRKCSGQKSGQNHSRPIRDLIAFCRGKCCTERPRSRTEPAWGCHA